MGIIGALQVYNQYTHCCNNFQGIQLNYKKINAFYK